MHKDRRTGPNGTSVCLCANQETRRRPNLTVIDRAVGDTLSGLFQGSQRMLEPEFNLFR